MADTSIRVSTAAKKRLELQKRAGESFDDVIMRLTSRDHWAGFGIASGEPGEAREGIAELHQSMRDRMDRDIRNVNDARPGQ